HLPHGASAPSLRALRLEGIPGRGEVLDRHDDARAVRPVDSETAVNVQGKNILVLGLGDTGLSMARFLTRRKAGVRVADTRAAARGLGERRAPRPAVAGRGGAGLPEPCAGAARAAATRGVPPGGPPLADARGAGMPALGDIELFARSLDPAHPPLV